jgi:hypothetical protein
MIRSYQGRLSQFPVSCYLDSSAQVIGGQEAGQ